MLHVADVATVFEAVVCDHQVHEAPLPSDREARPLGEREASGHEHGLVGLFVGGDELGSFRGEAAFGTWMHRLAVNTALNRLRRRGRRPEVEKAAEPPPTPPDTDETVLNQRVLGQALDRLPDGYRQVLVMHDVEGMTHEEIAERLGVAIGTSKSQLHKARARMRDLLAPAVGRNEAGSHA